MTKDLKIPKHIAIILDGNGRWAKQKGLPRIKGHFEGVKRVLEIVEAAHLKGVKVLTLFAFSTENWNRPKGEVSALMNLLSNFLSQQLQKLIDNNIKFLTIGQAHNIPDGVLKVLTVAKEKTRNNSGLILNLAFNYGSRLEIVDAVKNIANKVCEGELRAESITEDTVSDHLYTKGLPDPDLLIRTSGEKRISNFLLWQLSYAELYFTDVCWPDFKAGEFDKALQEYQNRERRFGKVIKK